MSDTVVIDYLIIGGGISGLYCAYSLHKKMRITNMVIIEKQNRLGGRIYTKYIDDTFLEMGAGVIVNKHINVLDLLSELGIHLEFGSERNKKSFAKLSIIPTDRLVTEKSVIPTIYKIDELVPIYNTDFYDIINELNGKLENKKFMDIAQNYCLLNLIEKYYGPLKAKQMMYQHGYYSDFTHYNAIDALTSFQHTFHPDAKFTRIRNGMITIIEKLTEYLEKNMITIRLDTECVNIVKNEDTYACVLGTGETLLTKNIILGIPKNNIMKMRYFDKIKDKLDTVENRELIRIYAIFPLFNGKVWFEWMDGIVTTDTILSQIIPIDKKRGILMIYCDDHNANMLYGFYQKGILKRELYFYLLKIFNNLEIPEPIDLYVSYNESATHVWKPTINSSEMYNVLRQPIPNENIFIIGEAYSTVQQWIEGAIKSVNDLISSKFNKQ